MEMVATNIRMPRKTLEELRIKAAKERKSLAYLVRDAIAKTYHIGAETGGIDPKEDPFYKLVGAFGSGITDGAVHHDRDIYGIDTEE